MKSPLDILFTLHPRKKSHKIKYQDERVSRIHGTFEVRRGDNFDDLPPMYQREVLKYVKQKLTTPRRNG